jgi:hypothetical protein
MYRVSASSASSWIYDEPGKRLLQSLDNKNSENTSRAGFELLTPSCGPHNVAISFGFLLE